MSEINYETKTAPGAIVDQGTFDSGKYFCTSPGEFEFGKHYIERHRLPLSERELFSTDKSLPEARKPYAEDKTVVVTSIEGQRIKVADLFHLGEEVLSGASREYILSPEGWIIPEGLTPDIVKSFTADMKDLIKGYFSPFDGLENEILEDEAERALVRNKKDRPPLDYLEAVPDGYEIVPNYVSENDRQKERRIWE